MKPPMSRRAVAAPPPVSLPGATALTGLIAFGLLVMPVPARAQAVTFADLENHTVTANFTYGQTVKLLEANNRVVNNENRQTMTLTIGPGDRIGQEYRIQIVATNGREVGGFKGNIKAELNKPTKWQHGDMVFVFENSSLIRLQTFNKGGRKITVSFKRTPAGLTCSVDAPFSKEEGAGSAVDTTSQTNRQRIEILSAKTVSSSCRVTKTPG
jgi:hypothetical protein